MKHQLYLQLRRCLLEQQIVCDLTTYIMLGGLALQAEFGDYSVEVNYENCKKSVNFYL